jgi:hypothetical protein
MELKVNYQPITAVLTPPAATWSGTPWMWTELTSWSQTPAPWVRDIKPRIEGWRGISGEGHALALVVSVKATGPVIYEGSELMIEGGGAL